MAAHVKTRDLRQNFAEHTMQLDFLAEGLMPRCLTQQNGTDPHGLPLKMQNAPEPSNEQTKI